MAMHMSFMISFNGFQLYLFLSVFFLAQLFERFLITVLNLFRQIINCEDYNPPRATLTECESIEDTC